MGFFTHPKNNKNENFDTSAHQFDAFIKLYLSELDDLTSGHSVEHFRVAIIATSPAAEVSKAILRHASDFSKRNIKVRAIFASIDSKDDLHPWLKNSSPLSNYDWLEDIRWANKRELMDAHEQIILGLSMCWSGDAMRRQSRAPYLIDLFEKNCEVKTRMARLAFEALWTVSIGVPISTANLSRETIPTSNRIELSPANPGLFDSRSRNIPTRH